MGMTNILSLGASNLPLSQGEWTLIAQLGQPGAVAFSDSTPMQISDEPLVGVHETLIYASLLMIQRSGKCHLQPNEVRPVALSRLCFHRTVRLLN
jgi:hypothetical protein